MGGLVGMNEGTVSGAYATGEVSGSRAVGGLIGRNWGSLNRSYATTTVSGSWKVGGLAGDGGRISASYATGRVSGDEYVGGLAGEALRISASYATGEVSGDQYVGGLAGGSSGGIIASYATGKVTGSEYVGGLVGFEVGKVVASYATGGVSGNQYVGGLIGGISSQPSRVADSFWNTGTSGTEIGIGKGVSDGAEGKTTADLQSPTGYTGIYTRWNVDVDDADRDDNTATGRDDPWYFGTSSQYPLLKVDFDGDGVATWQEFRGQDPP